jgi:hypothetical protein
MGVVDPSSLIDIGAFGLVVLMVLRWFSKVEASMDRLTTAITNQNDAQHRMSRALTLLVGALREENHLNREALIAQALDELERRKDTR